MTAQEKVRAVAERQKANPGEFVQDSCKALGLTPSSYYFAKAKVDGRIFPSHRPGYKTKKAAQAAKKAKPRFKKPKAAPTMTTLELPDTGPDMLFVLYGKTETVLEAMRRL